MQEELQKQEPRWEQQIMDIIGLALGEVVVFLTAMGKVCPEVVVLVVVRAVWLIIVVVRVERDTAKMDIFV